MTFAPGPWTVGADSKDGIGPVIEINNKDNHIANVVCSPALGITEMDRATARLIEAAPDMLEYIRSRALNGEGDPCAADLYNKITGITKGLQNVKRNR